MLAPWQVGGFTGERENVQYAMLGHPPLGVRSQIADGDLKSVIIQNLGIRVAVTPCIREVATLS